VEEGLVTAIGGCPKTPTQPCCHLQIKCTRKMFTGVKYCVVSSWSVCGRGQVNTALCGNFVLGAMQLGPTTQVLTSHSKEVQDKINGRGYKVAN
jgi:hypothetical protein